MSEQNEDIKGLFDAAFAAEQVAFDPNAWAQMEALLNQRQRRRAIWMWFTGLVIFISAASWYAIDAKPALVYSPRYNSTQFAQLGTLGEAGEYYNGSTAADETKTVSEENLDKANETAKAMVRDYENEIVKSDLSSVREEESMATSSDDLAQNDNDIISEPPSNLNSIDSKSEVQIIAAENVPNSNQDDDMVRERTMSTLDYMPIADFELSPLDNPIKGYRDPVKSLTKKPWVIYIRGGVSKSRMNSTGTVSGFGQFLGVGAQKQLAAHVLASAETGFSRTRFFDQATISTGTSFGYSSSENSAIVTTSEMLMLEVPLLLHYRVNRLMIGAGVSPTLLMGIKNSTEEIVSDETTNVSTNTFDGYYRWNRFHTLGAQGVLDGQFQLSDDSFLGVRAKASLRNPVADQSANGSYSHFDIYLRINIK